MSLVEQTWDQILYGLDSVLDLCCSLGLKEDVATSRFLKHRDRLGYLIDALRQRGQERARELYDTDRLAHIVAIAESGELINLGPFVQNHKKDRALSKKLQAALSGPEFPDEEDKNSNHARNILFELTFAAKLWTAGLEPTLGDPPDLSCEIDGKALLIECKRLSRKTARDRGSRMLAAAFYVWLSFLSKLAPVAWWLFRSQN